MAGVRSVSFGGGIVQPTPTEIRRSRFAQQLLEAGSSTAPVQHPFQALARLGQALAGTLNVRGVEQSFGERQQRTQTDLANALSRAGRAKPFVNPDTGQIAPGTTQQDVLARALLESGNTDLAPLATQAQLGSMLANDASQRRLADARAAIPVQAEAAAATTTATRTAAEPFNIAAEARADERQLAAESRAEAAAIRSETRAELANVRAEGRANKEARLRAKFQQGLATDFERVKAGIAFELEAAKSALEAGQPKDAKEIFNQETKLRQEFTKLAGTFLDVQSAYGRITTAQPTAQGDISLIISYMKMLDPGSVVREGEFATAQNAAGVPQRVRNTFNRLLSGERLTDGQRAGFRSQADALFLTELETHNQLISEYAGLAGQYGLDADRVVRDLVSQQSTGTPESTSGISQSQATQLPEGTIVEDDDSKQRFIVQGGQLVPFGGQ